jgi:hypothetical protein
MNIWPLPQEAFGANRETRLLKRVSQEALLEEQDQEIVIISNDTRHFIAECPYEDRGENGGRLILKDKSKSSPAKHYSKKNHVPFDICKPIKKNYPNKKIPTINLMVHEVYTSGDEDDEEDNENVGVAAIAITSTLSTSLFDAPTRTPPTLNTSVLWLTLPR